MDLPIWAPTPGPAGEPGLDGGTRLVQAEKTDIQAITGVGSAGLADLTGAAIDFIMPNKPVVVRCSLMVTVNVDQKQFILAITDMSNVVLQWATPAAPGATVSFPAMCEWHVTTADYAEGEHVFLKARGAVQTGATAGQTFCSAQLKCYTTADMR